MAFLAGIVLVPKFPPIPRLSIIVPVGNDVSAFEDTLVSVLENRPAASEVIVPHDGRYGDPFDLGDEAQLVVTEGGNFVDTVMAGVRAARGDYVHVISGGLSATDGWTDAALMMFEEDAVAAVAPVVRSTENHQIVSCGWNDTGSQLFRPVGAGRSEVGTDTSATVGVYLDASFWRRSVLLSLGDAFLYNGGHDRVSVSETTYVFHHLLQQAGWQCTVADHCSILSQSNEMVGEEPSVERGRRIGAAKRHFDAANASIRPAGVVKAAIGCLTRRGEFGQWYGRATSGSQVAQLQRRLRPEIVQAYRPEEAVLLPHAPQQSRSVRRAA